MGKIDQVFFALFATAAAGGLDFGENAPELSGHSVSRLALEWISREVAIGRSGPMLTSDDHEIIESELVFGRPIQKVFVHVGPKLFTQRQATIFSVREHLDLVLKYEINCDSLDDIHPSLREAIMLKLVQDLGVSPKLVYVSAPEKFFISTSTKTKVAMSEIDLTSCAAHPRSAVRVLAMEHVGRSLSDVVRLKYKRGLPIRTALEISISLLDVIEKLHSRGVIHGDIHSGNVMLSGKHIKVIDFGYSILASDFMGSPVFDEIDESGEAAALQKTETDNGIVYPHCLHSVFRMQGSRLGFRDDLFRALHVLAVMLSGEEFVHHCIFLESYPLLLMQKKKYEYYFQVTGKRDPVMQAEYLSAEAKNTIKFHLSHAMLIARSQAHPDAPARIDEVRAELQAALAVVSGLLLDSNNFNWSSIV